MMEKKLLEDFIDYFRNDKYKFEQFCKVFLTWLGFDDVVVTPSSRDKGIDLRCTKKEIDGIDAEDIEYIVQAKCYKIGNNVSGPEMRNFKGTRETLGKRRIFITTSDYTKDAIDESKDPNQPVTLISGQNIMDYCKSLGDKVFDVQYTYNQAKLDDLFVADRVKEQAESKDGISDELIKRITKNDVRARILRIPGEYKKYLSERTNYKLVINGGEEAFYNINNDGTYFGGVTKYYKSFIQDNDFNEARSIWRINLDKEIIYVEIQQ